MIWLKYQYGSDSTVAERFRELSLYEKTDVERTVVQTLRRKSVTKVFSSRKVWELTIGADELLQEDKREFCREWWGADKRWFCENPSVSEPSAGSFIEVTTEGGEEPITFVDGNKHLPSATYKLTESEGS